MVLDEINRTPYFRGKGSGMKTSFFNMIIAVISVGIALVNPESQFTTMVLAEYALTVVMMLFILLKNRMNVKFWAGAAVTAVYAVPAMLLLIQRSKEIPMESTMGRIVIGGIAILMLVTGIFKLASEEKAA